MADKTFYCTLCGKTITAFMMPSPSNDDRCPNAALINDKHGYHIWREK